jgi:hypothetical protein
MAPTTPRQIVVSEPRHKHVDGLRKIVVASADCPATYCTKAAVLEENAYGKKTGRLQKAATGIGAA